MGWRLKEVTLAGELHQAAGVHDRNPVDDLRDYGEIVRNEQHGQPELRTQIGEQLQDLRLNGDIQGGGGLVGDQQLRPVHDGHGDHHALPHTS